MKTDSLNTAFLAIMAAAMVLLVWRDVNRPVLSAADIALAVMSPELCRNQTVKPAELEP